MPPIPPPAISTGRGEEGCEVGVGAPDMPRLSMQRRVELVAGGNSGWLFAAGCARSASLVRRSYLCFPQARGLGCIATAGGIGVSTTGQALLFGDSAWIVRVQ